MELPIYDLKIKENINDDSEVDFVALVDKPAIQRDFLAFKTEFIEPSIGENKDAFLGRCIPFVINEGKEQEQAIAICSSIWDNRNSTKLAFQITNEEQRIISGPLMLADTPIYRNSDKLGEHYIKFSADTIKQIAIKFSKKGYHKNVNIMHESDMQVDGLIMFESFITDEKRGIKPMAGFEDVPDGSWFGSFYVENEKVWEAVKLGLVKGFSVEGLFDYQLPKQSAEEMLQSIAKTLGLDYKVKNQ